MYLEPRPCLTLLIIKTLISRQHKRQLRAIIADQIRPK
ncbi:hypothetical protein RB2083_3080 [Rhodobacteraceae bacterium HTCC2083]|nr:hypothetical protein RB2083_3080 [Rhodobacteraceae bacterium HTCC2083]